MKRSFYIVWPEASTSMDGCKQHSSWLNSSPLPPTDTPFAVRSRCATDAARQSNHSKVNSAMREVERRARTAGGRVWALIRGQSRQHSSDDEADDDDDEDRGDGGNAGVNGVGAGGGAEGAGRTPTRTTHGGDNGSNVNSNGNGNGNDAAAPEWVLSRLELMRMRRRGSFLDGDEIGPVRTAAAAGVGPAPAGTATGGAVASGGGGSGGEVVTAESFGNLARLAAAEGNEDRRDTDEAVAVLGEAMKQHSAALARLAGWMVQTAAPANGGGNGGSGTSIGAFLEAAPPARNQPTVGGAATPVKGGEARRGSLSPTNSPPPPPPLSSLDLTGENIGESYTGESAGEEGVRAVLELSRESDVLEGRVKRERFRAHRAADEEIHRTPGLYKDACTLGNALILKGHDYLSQVYMNDILAVAGNNHTRSFIPAIYIFMGNVLMCLWRLLTQCVDGRRAGNSSTPK